MGEKTQKDREHAMLFFWLFLLFAAAVTAAVCLAGGGVALGIVSFVLAFALAHVIYLAVFRLLSRKTDLSRPGEQQSPAARMACAATGEFLCFYAGLRPHISGTEKLPEAERFVFVCNHRSMFDPLMVMSCLAKWNIAFISKPSNLQIPLVGGIARAAGFLAIDRENDRKALRTILAAADYLKRGLCSIGIYPEGTRSHTNAMLPFHKGSFKVAQRANVPLVIACVRGTEKLKNGFLLHPHDVYLDILECLPAAQVKAMSTGELAEHSRALMQDCLDREEGKA